MCWIKAPCSIRPHGWMCFLTSPAECSLTPAPPSQAQCPQCFPCLSRAAPGTLGKHCPVLSHWHPLEVLQGCSFSTAKVLRVSRDPFVTSPFSVELDLGLLVSAGRVCEAFLHPALAPVFAGWDTDSWLAWVGENLPFGVEELPEWAAGHTWKQQAALFGVYPGHRPPALAAITELLWRFLAKSLANVKSDT